MIVKQIVLRPRKCKKSQLHRVPGEISEFQVPQCDIESKYLGVAERNRDPLHHLAFGLKVHPSDLEKIMDYTVPGPSPTTILGVCEA